jgi:hypothetical protein
LYVVSCPHSHLESLITQEVFRLLNRSGLAQVVERVRLYKVCMCYGSGRGSVGCLSVQVCAVGVVVRGSYYNICGGGGAGAAVQSMHAYVCVCVCVCVHGMFVCGLFCTWRAWYCHGRGGGASKALSCLRECFQRVCVRPSQSVLQSGQESGVRVLLAGLHEAAVNNRPVLYPHRARAAGRALTCCSLLLHANMVCCGDSCCMVCTQLCGGNTLSHDQHNPAYHGLMPLQVALPQSHVYT